LLPVIVLYPLLLVGALVVGRRARHRLGCRGLSLVLRLGAGRLPVLVQPEIGVWPGNDEDDLIFLRDSAVSWSHGEEGWDRAT
jgi:hypothetical protein